MRNPGVNNFKLLAALLVIAIHTSPLTSLSPEADFVLTRILARTAVPFFFMVTGYFVLPRAEKSTAAALSYLKRIGFIYLGSMALYLPAGVYAGHFENAGPISILKMIFLDGTFYHLWYLPALILGFALMVLLLRTLPFPLAGTITGFLYLAGLLGDSYYGFLPEGSLLFSFYEGLFHVFEYTRNGLFFAPAFLFLGILPAKKKRPSFSLSLGGLGLSMALLLGEGIFLKVRRVQRHDSMYVFLIPVMYFLFSILLDARTMDLTRRCPRELPLLVYLLHPLFLILVRGVAKATGLNIFVNNSLLHFLAVAVSTFIGSFLLLLLWERAREALPVRKQQPR